MIYVKQVNGYHIGIEEALIGQDKLIFKSLWKTKGNYNREVLLRNAKASPYPQNADEAVKNDSISNPSLEQGNPLQSHPSNTQNLTTKDKIKQARELGLNAKEAVHYIKTNNLPQTRANTLPQGREILEAEIVETQEIPYSQKKLIEWIINKHPKLIGSNQQARLTTKELLEFIKEENLPAKEALKLIKNTPRNLPIKIDNTSKQTTQNVDSSDPKPQINKAIKDIDTANFNAPSENPTEIIPQKFGRNYRKFYKDFTIKSPEIAEFRNRVTLDHQLRYVPYGTELEMLTNPFERTTYFNPFYKSTKGNFAYLSEDGVIDDFQVVEKTDKYIIYDRFGIANIVDRESGLHLGKLYEFGKPLKLSNAIVLPSGLVEKWGITKKMLSFEEALKKAKNRVRGNIIDTTDRSYEPIRHILTRKTKDGVALKTLKIQKKSKIWEIEPTTGIHITPYPKLIENMDSKALKELLLSKYQLANPNYNDQKELLKLGINDKYLSPFQKELKEEILKDTQPPQSKKEFNADENSFEPLENLHNSPQGSGLKGDSVEAAEGQSSDIIFTDKKGKEHTLTKQTQDQWLNTFNLKSLDEAYTPKHTDEILQALGGKEIKLQLGSLKKLVAQGREQYIPQIKEVLDTPEAIMRDDMGEYLFIKHLKDDDYFVNVSFDNGEYLVSISNGIKETRNLNNKLEKGGEFIYQSPNFNSISQKLLQTSQYSANKIDRQIIPQNANALQKAQMQYQQASKEREQASKERDEFFNKYPKLKGLLQRLSVVERNTDELYLMQDQSEADKIIHALNSKYTNPAKYNRLKEGDLGAFLSTTYEEGAKFYISQDNPYTQKQTKELIYQLFNIDKKILSAQFKEMHKEEAFNHAKYAKELNDRLKEYYKHPIHKKKEAYNQKVSDFKKRAKPIEDKSKVLQQELEVIGKEWERLSYEGVPDQDLLKIKAQFEAKEEEIRNFKNTTEYKQMANERHNLIFDEFLNEEDEVIKELYKMPDNHLARKLINLKQTKIDSEVSDYSPYANARDRYELEQFFQQNPIKEFGTNYAEHYHSGESAIQKLLTEAQAHKQSGAKTEYKGQVAGAFYRDDIGDITLAWGEKGTGKSDGWGLSKIAEYHPEVLDKLDKLIQDLPIVKETENRYKLDNGDFFISIRKDFEGQKQNWVLTALERDESIARRRTDLPSSQSEAEKTTSANATAIIPQQKKDLAQFVKEYQQEYNALNSKLEAQVEALQKQIQNSSDDEWQKLTFQKIDLLEQQEQAHELFIEVINKLTPNYKNYDEILQITPLNEEHRIILNHRAEDIYQTLLKQAEKKVKAQAPTQQQVKQALEVIDTAFQKRIKEPFAIYEKEWYFDNTKITNLHDAQKFRHTINADKHREYYTDELNKAYSILDKHEEAQTLKEKGVKSTQAGRKTHEDYLNVRDEIEAKAYQAKNTTQPSKQNVSTKELLQKLEAFLHSKNAQNVDSSVESTPPKDTQTPQAQKVDSTQPNFTYTTGEAKGIAELRKDLKQALEPSLNKEIVNKEQGLSGVITTEEVKKIMSSKAVAKSVANGFSRDEHIEVAKHIERLFTESKLLRSHKDYKENPNILQVHRFVKDIEVNGKEANALITLFEKMQGKNKIYTIELESLENLPPLSTQAKSARAAVKAQSAAATPTEAAPIAKTDNKIIPQTQISNIKKQLVELKQSKSAYQKVLKDLERNMKDVELEERYSRGEESIKVFERKRLIQSSIDEHTQGLNAVLKKMIELHKQLPENVRYTKEVLDDLTKIEAILKGNNYSLEQALRLSKITQRLQEKAIIESESFLNKVYNLDDFAKGAKSLRGTSYAYNTNDTIRKYFKIIAEMIDSIPAFKKISANQPETLPTSQTPKVDSSESSFTYTTGEAKGIAELRKDLKQALEPYKSTPITNKETGLQGVVTTDEINKIASKKAVDKSVANGFTRDEHFTAAQHLKNLFENSKFKESHADNKHRENIKVHRFIKDIHINDKLAQAKITLFEKIEGKNRIYTLELESLNKPDSLSASVPNTESAAKAQSVATARPETTTIAKTDGEIIPQQKIKFAMEKFNYDEKKAKDLLEWHKDSDLLTKDERDLPRVFYHGSGARFQVFKKEFDETKTGFWFADRKIIAEDFAKNKGEKAIYPVFLKMKNPIWLTYQKEGDKWVFDWLDEEGKTLLKEAKNQGLSIDYFQKDFKFKEFLKSKGYDGIVLKTKINAILQHSVFDSNQIKHIDNKGIYTDTKGNIKNTKPKDTEAKHKYFNESSPNIFHSNPHAAAGLLGGSVAGIEQDENGNLTFSPEKFVLGLLGGAAGSKAVSSGYKRFLEKNPQRIIPLINKQKYTEPRFEVTKELEKTYRNAQVKPNEKIKETLKLSGVIKGDFIKLAQKHPEYFANPQEAKELCDYVFENAFIGLQASDKKQALIIAKLQDSNNDYGSVAFRIQNINGEHRIRSVILMEQKQVDLKIQNAKKLGEPIFHFW